MAAASGDELDHDSRDLAAALAQRTDGNPFFANQVLRHLVERGVLVQDGGRWTIKGSLDDVDLPEGVLDVVGRRLSHLSPGANQTLRGGTVRTGVRGAGAARGARRRNPRRGRRRPRRSRPCPPAGRDRARALRLHARHRPRHAHPRAHHGQTGPAAPGSRRGDPRRLRRRAHVPLAELARHFTEAAVLGDAAAAARWATAAAARGRRPGRSPRRRRRAGTRPGCHRGRRARRPDRPVRRFRCAGRTSLRPRGAAHLDGSAVDAARQLRSGPRLLRIGMASVDPEAIRLCEEALQLLDPEAAPIHALGSRPSPGSGRSSPSLDSSTTSKPRTDLLTEIDPGAPRVGAAVRWMIALAA